MQNTTNGTLTEDEIIELLVNSGYEEGKIKEALKQTQSSNVDALVDYIIKMEEQPMSIKVKRYQPENNENQTETLKLIEENKRRIQMERKYRDELIRRTIEDRENREKEEKDVYIDEKVCEIQYDCTINVRFPDSRCIKYCFTKEETVNDLFNKIEGDFGSKNFKIFKSRTSQAIERSNDKLENNKLLFPRSVLFLEE